MNLKEKQKAESKEKILKAAASLFREKGYQATGVDELMEKAGLTAGAFYAHFKSKQKLLEEVLSFSLNRNRGFLLEGTHNLKGSELVEAILKKYVSELHRDNPQAGCPLPAIGAELSRQCQASQEIVSQYLQEWIRTLSPHLKGKEQEVKSEALRLLCQAIGAVLLSRMTDPDFSQQILEAASVVKK